MFADWASGPGRHANLASALGGVRPVIDRSFGFGDAPAAFDYLREARHVGTVVIEHQARSRHTFPGRR